MFHLDCQSYFQLPLNGTRVSGSLGTSFSSWIAIKITLADTWFVVTKSIQMPHFYIPENTRCYSWNLTPVSQHKLSSSYLISNYHLSNPLQYSCLENPVVREAWWATVHGVAQSWTRLKRLSVHACIGEGNGNPLQYSCLENPRDGGAWWAAVYGVAQSRTWLKWLSRSSSSNIWALLVTKFRDQDERITFSCIMYSLTSNLCRWQQ